METICPRIDGQDADRTWGEMGTTLELRAWKTAHRGHFRSWDGWTRCWITCPGEAVCLHPNRMQGVWAEFTEGIFVEMGGCVHTLGSAGGNITEPTGPPLDCQLGLFSGGPAPRLGWVLGHSFAAVCNCPESLTTLTR